MAAILEILCVGLLWVGRASASSWPQQHFHTERFEVPNMTITRSGVATEPGYLFYTLTDFNTAPIIMTDSNELVWHGPGHSDAENFRTATLHNEPVLSYWAGHKYDHPLNTFGHGTGFVVIMDNSYQTKYNICISDDTFTWVTPFPHTFPGKQTHPCFLDRHESFVTNRGTLIATAFNVTRGDLRPVGGPKHGWIFDALFFEIDIATSEILFRWSALEHIDITTSNYVNQGAGNPLSFMGSNHGSSQSTAWDFFHINSVQPLNDGGYLVNSRMTWSMYKVDGKTGKVIWTLEGSHGGDFTLEPGIFFSWQHMPRMHSLTADSFEISLFNNDNIRGLVQGTNHSTGYLLHVDATNMHVKSLHNFIDRRQKIFSLAEGSHQVLGDSGHSLIGYGAEPFIKEFDAKGKSIYNAQFAPKTGFVSAGQHSYRAYRYKWQGFPTQKPRAKAVVTSAKSDASSSDVKVFMSWNGATEYDGWNIYAGSSRKSLQKVGKVAKTGFETHHVIKAGTTTPQYVLVEATKGSKGLANSTAVQVKSS